MRTTKIRFFSNEHIFITRTSSPFAAKQLQPDPQQFPKRTMERHVGGILSGKKEWPWWSLTSSSSVEKWWDWKTNNLHFSDWGIFRQTFLGAKCSTLGEVNTKTASIWFVDVGDLHKFIGDIHQFLLQSSELIAAQFFEIKTRVRRGELFLHRI